ncbi:Metacaspase-1 [Acorus calamus]|uniref:Metacaspase-1 n=1 Tax=Acorus calamus TaxID=4465 RepID=A0AAV9CG29_ACOCL|nr:Metacaspase-1 [Acorus calamus]
MANNTQRCSHCGVLLVVPQHARTIRCAICKTITSVAVVVRPDNDPLHRVHCHVRRATKWVKGLISQVSTQGMYPGSGGYSNYNNRPMTQLTYPAVHGKKRALLIGVTYRSRSYELQGSINDVECMRYFLRERFGFPNDCILVLTEDETDPNRIPTKMNMQAAMRWLVHDSQAGDSLVFHFSGHGSQRRDVMGDEIDGYDETLCPLDYETEGMLVDDEINDTIVKPLTTGVMLHAFIDACHSGTILDLPYVCRMDRAGFCQWEDHRRPEIANKDTSGGLAISFSGCDDCQTSVDTKALSGYTTTGAMTFSFIQAVESEPGVTYGRLLADMRSVIRGAETGPRINGPIASLLKKVFRSGLTQEPQLSSSEMFDVYRKTFIL